MTNGNKTLFDSDSFHNVYSFMFSTLVDNPTFNSGATQYDYKLNKKKAGELSYNVFDNNKKRPTGLDNKT